MSETPASTRQHVHVLRFAIYLSQFAHLAVTLCNGTPKKPIRITCMLSLPLLGCSQSENVVVIGPEFLKFLGRADQGLRSVAHRPMSRGNPTHICRSGMQQKKSISRNTFGASDLLFGLRSFFREGRLSCRFDARGTPATRNARKRCLSGNIDQPDGSLENFNYRRRGKSTGRFHSDQLENAVNLCAKRESRSR